MKSRLLKTSMLKKAICFVLLFVILCLSLASCKKVETITLKSASCIEGGYDFDYNEGWRVNYNGDETMLYPITVGGQLPEATLRFTVFENKGFASAKEYWEDGAENFNTAYESHKINSRESFLPKSSGDFKDGYIAKMAVSISGATGLMGQPTKDGESANYTLIQLVFNSGDRICCGTYLSTAEKSINHESIVDSVKLTFNFTEAKKTTVTDKGFTDFIIKAPEGWTLTESEAYLVFNKGNATVVANAYSLNYSKASSLYWKEDYQPSLEKGLKGFTVVSLNEKASLGGLSAVDCVYKGVSASGTEYTFRTVLAVGVSEVYLLTLTASEADYQGCVSDFLKMAEGFALK